MTNSKKYPKVQNIQFLIVQKTQQKITQLLRTKEYKKNKNKQNNIFLITENKQKTKKTIKNKNKNK